MHPLPTPAMVLFLQLGMLIPPVHAKEKCNDTTKYDEGGKCCNKCPPGYSMTEKCGEGSINSSCAKCEDGYYTHDYNTLQQCKPCESCSAVIGQVEVKSCTNTSNVVCACPNGTHEVTSGEIKRCCSNCSPGEKITKECGVDLRTNCTPCDDETYSNGSGICIPCTKCKSSENETSPCAKTNDRRCEPKKRDAARGTLIRVIVSAIVTTVVIALIALVAILSIKFCCKKSEMPEICSEKMVVKYRRASVVDMVPENQTELSCA